MALPSADVVIAEVRLLGVHVPAGPARVDGYGDSPQLSADLLALIREGRKRAGTALLWALQADGEALARAGEIEIAVDHLQRPALVTRLTQVDVVPYSAVSAEYAAIEGEGDGSLAYWRRAHWAFFGRECQRIGREPNESMPVVCSVFELLAVVPPPTPSQVLQTYCDLWMERDATRCAAMVRLSLTPDAQIIGPGYGFVGHQAVIDEVARFHRDDPGMHVRLTSGFDVHSGVARFTFALFDADGKPVNEGWDVVEFAADGRLAKVISFWGALPGIA